MRPEIDALLLGCNRDGIFRRGMQYPSLLAGELTGGLYLNALSTRTYIWSTV